jgi:c-di-GMP-binding flagellar brake protein YcgR
MERQPLSLLISAEPILMRVVRSVAEGTPTEVALGIAQVLLLTTIVVALAFAAWFRCVHYYRAWLAERLRCFSESGMSSPDVLMPGMPVRVEVPVEGNMATLHGVLDSAVLDRVELSLQEPPLPVPVPTPVLITAVGTSAAYRFQQTTLHCESRGGVWHITVPMPRWVERVQRRDFYRVALGVPASLSVCGDTRSDTFSAEVEDLSVGGVSLLVREPVAVGTPVRIRMVVGDLGTVALDARVVAVEESVRDRQRLRCQFLYVSEETRQALMQYCVLLQREGRRAAA